MDQRVKLAYLDPQPGERVLDVGCGTGRHLRQLLENQSDPCGVDLSFGMLKIASQARPGLRWCKQIPNGRYPSPVGPSVPCCVPLSESTWRHCWSPCPRCTACSRPVDGWCSPSTICHGRRRHRGQLRGGRRVPPRRVPAHRR